MSNLSESLLSFFCHERPERIANGCSFVKSKSLKSLNGEKSPKTVKNVRKIWFSRESLFFWERLARIMSKSLTLLCLKEQIAHSCSLKWAILSERFFWRANERKSEFPTLSQTLCSVHIWIYQNWKGTGNLQNIFLFTFEFKFFKNFFYDLVFITTILKRIYNTCRFTKLKTRNDSWE